MQKLEQLYEGKAKKVFATEDPALVVVAYKDDATAGDGAKKGTIQGKGAINNRLTNHLLQMLEDAGVPTHYVRQQSDRETLVKKVEIIPVEVIVRNIAAGSFARRLGVDEGTPLARTVLEYCYKNDELHDPMVNHFHILAMGWAGEKDLATIEALSMRINELLCVHFEKAGLRLVDFKLEFGRTVDGALVLADEISPDTCRLWDMQTDKKLDKDRFRRDMGEIEEAYREVERRLLGE